MQKRLRKLEERTWPACRGPRQRMRMILSRADSIPSFETATCRRTLRPDGT